MKINNLKLHPHIASFIAGALAEQAADVKDTIGSMVGNGKIKAMQMVLDKTDADKFRHPEDIDRIMDTIMLLGEGWHSVSKTIRIPTMTASWQNSRIC